LIIKANTNSERVEQVKKHVLIVQLFQSWLVLNLQPRVYTRGYSYLTLSELSLQNVTIRHFSIKKSSIMKQLSIVLGFCLFFVFGFNTETQANHDVEIETSIAKRKTIKFKVYGNCGMCKTTIETALKGVKGIRYAIWDVEKKMITVSFNPKKIEEMDIHKKIAAVGYDTDKVKAKDEIYNNLHGCCQYDRPKGK
jgi:mercuric ion binding protein